MPANTLGYSFAPSLENAEGERNSPALSAQDPLQVLSYRLPKWKGAAGGLSPMQGAEQLGSSISSAVLDSIIRTVLGPQANLQATMAGFAPQPQPTEQPRIPTPQPGMVGQPSPFRPQPRDPVVVQAPPYIAPSESQPSQGAAPAHDFRPPPTSPGVNVFPGHTAPGESAPNVPVAPRAPQFETNWQDTKLGMMGWDLPF